MSEITTVSPVVRGQITKATAAAHALVIKTTEDLKKAVDILSRIKKVGKIIKDEKEKITKPLNEGLRAARALFLPFEAQWEEAEQIVKDKMLDYNKRVDQERIKQEEKIAAKVDAGILTLETAAKKLEKIEEAPKSVEGNVGKVSVKKIKKFRVVDISKLPIQYHLANEVLIRQEMLNGVELPGVEYFEESIIASR